MEVLLAHCQFHSNLASAFRSLIRFLSFYNKYILINLNQKLKPYFELFFEYAMAKLAMMNKKALQVFISIILLHMVNFVITQKIIPDKKLGPNKPQTYKMPQNYEYSTQENWVHTKINHGLTNYTTGNMETELDFSLLPQTTSLKSNYPLNISQLILEDLDEEKRSQKLVENIILT